MPALQVKDFPSDLYEELRAVAQEQDRSISQQTVHLLRQALRRYRRDGEGASHVAPSSFVPDVPDVTEGRSRIADRRRRSFDAIDRLPGFRERDELGVSGQEA